MLSAGPGCLLVPFSLLDVPTVPVSFDVNISTGIYGITFNREIVPAGRLSESAWTYKSGVNQYQATDVEAADGIVYFTPDVGVPNAGAAGFYYDGTDPLFEDVRLVPVPGFVAKP